MKDRMQISTINHYHHQFWFINSVLVYKIIAKISMFVKDTGELSFANLEKEGFNQERWKILTLALNHVGRGTLFHFRLFGNFLFLFFLQGSHLRHRACAINR